MKFTDEDGEWESINPNIEIAINAVCIVVVIITLILIF